MKNQIIALFTALVLVFSLSTNAHAQQLDTSNMPKYVVLTAEDPGILMPLYVYIQKKKKSRYKTQLVSLENYLDDLKIKSITDLLNIMDELGYEYVNAFASEGVQNQHIEARITYNTVFKRQK